MSFESAMVLVGASIIYCTLFICSFLQFLKKHSPKQRKAAEKQYACGESLLVPIKSENFYKTFHQVLKRLYDQLSKMHNEKLTDYLLWVVVLLTILLLGGMFL